jgi:hypothetical protein
VVTVAALQPVEDFAGGHDVVARMREGRDAPLERVRILVGHVGAADMLALLSQGFVDGHESVPRRAADHNGRRRSRATRHRSL